MHIRTHKMIYPLIKAEFFDEHLKSSVRSGN